MPGSRRSRWRRSPTRSVVVCPPGLGDDVQATKAGILEIADVFVVSKGDLPAAERTVRDLKDMLALRARGAGWRAPVLTVTATARAGVAELADALRDHAAAAGIGRRLRPRPATTARGARRAQARVARLAARDAFVRHTGIDFVAGGLGTATVRMRVGPQHINFNGTCHGGALFTLADSAFGLACNSYGVLTAAIDCHVTFQVAVRDGDVLRGMRGRGEPQQAGVRLSRRRRTRGGSHAGVDFHRHRVHHRQDERAGGCPARRPAGAGASAG